MDESFDEIQSTFVNQIVMHRNCAEVNLGKPLPAIISDHNVVFYSSLAVAFLISSIVGLYFWHKKIFFMSSTDMETDVLSLTLTFWVIACLVVATFAYAANDGLKVLIENPIKYSFNFLNNYWKIYCILKWQKNKQILSIFFKSLVWLKNYSHWKRWKSWFRDYNVQHSCFLKFGFWFYFEL